MGATVIGSPPFVESAEERTSATTACTSALGSGRARAGAIAMQPQASPSGVCARLVRIGEKVIHHLILPNPWADSATWSPGRYMTELFRSS